VKRPRQGLLTVGYLHPGHLANCFAESLTDLLLADLAGRQRIMSHRFGKMAKECGSAGIVAGRNQIARAVLEESEADWLLFVDSDMGFAPDTAERLIATAHPTERPVVGGLCFAHKPDGKASHYGMRYRATPTLYDWYEDDERVGFVPRMAYERDKLQAVSATGAALVLIHRNALQAVRDKYGPTWFDPITHPTGPTTFSEDLSFCVRVAGCDMPLYVDTSIKTTHDKGGVFLDEAFFDHQEATNPTRAKV
jgi:hypothetical protein